MKNIEGKLFVSHDICHHGHPDESQCRAVCETESGNSSNMSDIHTSVDLRAPFTQNHQEEATKTTTGKQMEGREWAKVMN